MAKISILILAVMSCFLFSSAADSERIGGGGGGACVLCVRACVCTEQCDSKTVLHRMGLSYFLCLYIFHIRV